MRPKIFLLLLTAMACVLAHGQDFSFYTSDKELSSSLIMDIYQDRHNVIWIATEDGLNKYDGVKFKSYRHITGDSTSLSHNYVHTLIEDNDGNLIIGTFKGLQLYRPLTDSFSPLGKWDNGDTFTSFTTHLLKRRNGEIIATGNTVCKVKVKNDCIITEMTGLPVPSELVEYGMEDREGNMWFTRESDGIYKVSRAGKVTHYDRYEKNAAILYLCEGPNGEIIGGSPLSGLYIYDSVSDGFNIIPGSENLRVKKLYLSYGNVYVCTDGQGVKRLEPTTKTIDGSPFDNRLLEPANAKIHTMLRDSDGAFWFGIYQKGVGVIPRFPNSFHYIGPESLKDNVIGRNSVTSLLQTSDGSMLVGTDNDGLYILADKPDRCRHISGSGIPSIVLSAFEDSHGAIWLGSYSEGAFRLDKTSGKATSLDRLMDLNGRKVRNVYDFAEDSKQRVWIATMGAGLHYYDYKDGEFHYPDKLMPTIGVDWLCALSYSPHHDQLYIGSYGGLHIVDLKGDSIRNRRIFTDNIVHTIYENASGETIWVGTPDGLKKLTSDGTIMANYTEADGLPNNSVYGITGDADGSLWISTNHGLSHFFPSSGEFINYYVDDGLQGNEFCRNSIYKGSDGYIWLGGINGITYFKPAEITFPGKKWTVRITDFYVGDQSVFSGMTSGGRRIADRPVYTIKDFYLDHDDSSFSIEFSTRELGSGSRLNYYYAVNDTVWPLLPEGTNRVSFVNMNPGTHTFRLKARDFRIESDIVSVRVHIAPPWWQSVWAYITYGLLAIISLYMAFRIMRSRYRIRQRLLEHRHREEINESRQQFFFNISHEIKTPMSLILSPLRQLMDEEDTPSPRKRLYDIMYRNAQRILRLVNQMMDIRKIEKNEMRLHFRQIDAIGFIAEICDTFSQYAEKKRVNLTFSHPGLTELPLWVDPDNFDKVIFNVISNAMKYTPPEGNIKVELRASATTTDDRHHAGMASIIVTDSGKGIEPQDLERIFDRFYQSAASGESAFGTGIGLHLTRSLVRLHHGEIKAGNIEAPESGARFTIEIPLGNAHLSAIELQGYNFPPAAGGISHRQPIEVPESRSGSEIMKAKASVKRYIVIVEDDDEIRNYLLDELSQAYNVYACSDGKEALEAVTVRQPELILSDVMMPNIDGYSLCRLVKQNPRLRHIPVILLTAKTSDSDNLHGLELGADAYISKPFNIEILKTTISNIIDRNEHMRNLYKARQPESGETTPDDVPDLLSPDDRMLQRVMRIIKENLDNQELSAEKLAEEVGYTRPHLGRKLKKLTGMSTREFIRDIRMKTAADLLSRSRHSISEVADAVGYASLSSFSAEFKDIFGMSPIEYRDRHHDASLQSDIQ